LSNDGQGGLHLSCDIDGVRCNNVDLIILFLQLQNLRMRCEKRKQKDATQQQAELTAEQIAERKAKADAFAEVRPTSLSCVFVLHRVTVVVCLCANEYAVANLHYLC